MDLKTKYPKSPHLPESPGVNNDDTIIKDLCHLKKQTIVVTEKLDGENTTITSEKWHAR